MRADDDIDVAIRHVLQQDFRFFRGLKAGQHADANGERAEPLREIVVMLLGQQCGRHQHGDLTIVLDRFEGRPHGDLGLAVPDIAAHQSIHRLRGLQIALNVLDGFDLIGRFLILECRFKGMGQGRIFAILAALNDFAIGIQFHQLVGHLFNAFFNFRGRPSPTAPPNLSILGEWPSAPL